MRSHRYHAWPTAPRKARPKIMCPVVLEMRRSEQATDQAHAATAESIRGALANGPGAPAMVSESPIITRRRLGWKIKGTSAPGCRTGAIAHYRIPDISRAGRQLKLLIAQLRVSRTGRP